MARGVYANSINAARFLRLLFNIDPEHFNRETRIIGDDVSVLRGAPRPTTTVELAFLKVERKIEFLQQSSFTSLMALLLAT